MQQRFPGDNQPSIFPYNKILTHPDNDMFNMMSQLSNMMQNQGANFPFQPTSNQFGIIMTFKSYKIRC